MISSPATPTACLEQKFENFQSRNVTLSTPSPNKKIIVFQIIHCVAYYSAAKFTFPIGQPFNKAAKGAKAESETESRLPNPMKPGGKSRIKMYLEQRRQAVLQLHLSDRQLYYLLRCIYIRGLTVHWHTLIGWPRKHYSAMNRNIRTLSWP